MAAGDALIVSRRNSATFHARERKTGVIVRCAHIVTPKQPGRIWQNARFISPVWECECGLWKSRQGSTMTSAERQFQDHVNSPKCAGRREHDARCFWPYGPRDVAIH